MAATPQRTDLNIDEFRQLLTQERDSITKVERQNKAEMSDEDGDRNDNEFARSSAEGEYGHADNAAAIADHERFQALDDNEHAMLNEIDAAFARIEAGTYGICIVTGQPIPVERLRALPWASTVVEVADQLSEQE